MVIILANAFLLHYNRQTIPETFAFTKQGKHQTFIVLPQASIISVPQTQSIRILINSLFHNCKLAHSMLMELGEQEVAGTSDVLVRYTHAREQKRKYMKILGAYYLSNISVDPMCRSKQDISSKVKSQYVFPLRDRHNVNLGVAIKSGWVRRQQCSGQYYKMRYWKLTTCNGKTILLINDLQVSSLLLPSATSLHVQQFHKLRSHGSTGLRLCTNSTVRILLIKDVPVS